MKLALTDLNWPTPELLQELNISVTPDSSFSGMRCRTKDYLKNAENSEVLFVENFFFHKAFGSQAGCPDGLCGQTAQATVPKQRLTLWWSCQPWNETSQRRKKLQPWMFCILPNTVCNYYLNKFPFHQQNWHSIWTSFLTISFSLLKIMDFSSWRHLKAM